MINVSRNGLVFPVLAWGPESGRPVLLLHGFPQEPATWTPVATALAADGFRLYAPHQRGYLASTRPSRPPDPEFEDFVADVFAVADGLGLETFDVIGFGMGAMQAWLATSARPERVRSLTSLRVPHPAAFANGILSDPEQQAKWRELQKQFGASGLDERAAAMLANDAARLRKFLTDIRLPQPFLDSYVARLKEPGALVGALSWEHAISLDSFVNTPPISVPTLLLWSEGPGVARTSVAATRKYVHAAYDEVLIPDVGNFMLERAPELLIDPIRRHLQAT